MIKINIINQYDDSKAYHNKIRNIIKTGYRYLKLTEKMIVSVVLVDNSYIHMLNKQYRDIDKPTDVLSFENDSDVYEIGDVFIALDIVKQQAEDLQHSFVYELAFIALHGFLHCLGYDHVTDEENTEMMSLQKAIMQQANITR